MVETKSPYDIQIKRLEEDIQELKSRVDDFAEMKLILIELKTISRYQAERGDKLDTLIEEQGKTLISVCERMKMTEGSIGDLTQEVLTLKNDSNFKINDIIKDFTIAGIGALATFIVTQLLA